ncbi:hypothetical protein [Spiroplasma endosymbiont of Polydrusus pterygomalis]|uniref:hypothetical protein n=1 Tax=Spiroplasma endosymbiont of Polydrusus pterygomalis TaxID=3139327 RepID=UPI003CCB0A6A
MKDTKKDLQQEIEIFENEIMKLDEEIKNIVLKIKPLHQKLELALNKQLAIKKYSFRNIISFGLFNFVKKKKINQEISNLRRQINHFDDKKSQIKTKIIENYKTIFKETRDVSVKTDNFAKILTDVSVKTDNVNNKQRINTI